MLDSLFVVMYYPNSSAIPDDNNRFKIERYVLHMSFNPGGDGALSISGSNDVNLNNPASGDVLTYDSTTARWKNARIEGVFRITSADVNGLSDIRPLLLSTIVAAQAAKIPVVSLPAGTLPMATQCTIPNGFPITIEGQGEATVLQQTVASYPKAMFYAAGSDGSKVSLTSDLAAGTTTLTLPPSVASSLSTGDTVGFESNLVVFGIGSDGQEANASEYRLVESVSGNTVVIDGPLLFNYTIADGGVTYKVNLAPSVSFRNLWFSSTDPSVNKWRLIYLEKCRDIRIENVTLDNAGGGIYIHDCFGGVVNDVHIYRLQNITNFLGYGVAVMGRSAEITINNLRGRAMRHLFTTLPDERTSGGQWGGPRHITISNGVGFAAEAGYAVWDTHPPGYDIVFSNCHAFGGSTSGPSGFQIRSMKTKIINPVVRGISGVGMSIQTTASDCEIVGGEISECGLQGIKFAAPDCRIRGTRIYNNNNAGLSYGAACTNLLVDSCLIVDNQYGMQCSGTDDTGTGVVIKDNVIPKGSSRQNISMLSIKKPAMVVRNILSRYGTGSDGLYTPQTGLMVVGNTVDGSTV